MSDKIRKYVLPNLPYLFVFWFFSKIGTAYRIAPGTDFGTKLMGMLDTFPKAFETYWPGLGGIDLLVGLAGAAGVYLLIQSKIRQAKKFRRDAEYGTARFGTKEDIKPFVDPKFQNNVILTGTEFLTMNTRPKIPANARNLNACVIGSSGSGKTRFWLTPQLLQAHSSYVVVDPKGGTLDQCGRFLQREKYRVRVFNSIDFSKSMHYNPLAYIKTESDVLKFVTALIANTKGDGKEGDEFWTKAETLLYLYQGRDVKEDKDRCLKDQILVIAPHEALISSDTWLKCRKKLMANTTFQQGRKPKNTWLAGKIKCGHCGYALKATHVPNSTGYFRCTKRTENKGCPGCGKIRKEEFEQFIFSAMQEKFKDFQILHGREEKVNPKLTAYQVELAQVEAEIEKLLDTLTGANATLLAYANKKIEELDTRRQTISKAIAELSVETISPQQIKKLSYYLDNWDSIDFDDKRKAADGLISTIKATVSR